MKAALALVGVLVLMSFAFAATAPLSVHARAHGDFGRCEITGYYVFNGGWTTYSNILDEIRNEMASRIARGMV